MIKVICIQVCGIFDHFVTKILTADRLLRISHCQSSQPLLMSVPSICIIVHVSEPEQQKHIPKSQTDDECS